MARARSQTRLASALAGVAALALLLGLWLVALEQAPERGARSQPPAAATATAAAPSPAAPAGIAARARSRIELASDGVPIMPADPSDAVPAGPVHPHPHTPAHERIYRENNLFGQLNGAMDVGDVAGLRRLLEQYRDQYPEDAHQLQEGYALIADCLEHPSEATRSAGERYWHAHRSSLLRRYVRRHCLEATP